MKKSIAYIINDSEITAGTRGASLGPGAIRVVDDNLRKYLFSKYPIHYVPTVNFLLDKPTPYPYGKRADGLVVIYRNLVDVITAQEKENDFLLVVAGDHGAAGGTVSGLKLANPDKKLGVLWIDAHADIHSPYTTPSGNMHGMPVAAILNEDNLDRKHNDIDSETKRHWNDLKNIGGIAPKVAPEDFAYIGLRDCEEEELYIMDKLGMKNISVDELREVGVESILSRLDEKFAFCDEVYVSFDVDSMDPELTSKGTGTPVPHGLSPAEAKQILQHFAKNPKVKCIEFVEVNPCLDEKVNRMAEIAYDLIATVVETVENR